MKKLLILAAVLILTTSAGCCQSGCCGWCRKVLNPARRPASLLACRAVRVSLLRAFRPARWSPALKCIVHRLDKPAWQALTHATVPPGQGLRRWLTTSQFERIAVGRSILKAADRDGFRPMIPGGLSQFSCKQKWDCPILFGTRFRIPPDPTKVVLRLF